MFRLGAALAFVAVALGAFAAHGLKNHYGAAELHTFEVGVRYQMYHALALLVLGLLDSEGSRSAFRKATWAFALGTLLFSGSLYVLALTGIEIFGIVTPIGGLLFLAGWLILILQRPATTPE